VKYRTLGRTGLRVSEVGFGAWAIGGNAHGNSYGPTDDETSKQAIYRALALGCNFFDTADVYGYGHSEELLGQTLGRRDDVFIATKVGGNFYKGRTRMDFTPQYIRFAVEESLKRLRRDTIDLYQLHNPPLGMIQEGRVFQVMEELKQEGKIRFYGVSIFQPEEGLQAMRQGRPDTLQVVYNMVSQEPAWELFPCAQGKGVGIIAREPLRNGFLTGKYTEETSFVPGDIRHGFPRPYIRALAMIGQGLRQVARRDRTVAQTALRFVLNNEAVSVVIPGCKTSAQVEENMGASEASPLTAGDLAQMQGLMPG